MEMNTEEPEKDADGKLLKFKTVTNDETLTAKSSMAKSVMK